MNREIRNRARKSVVAIPLIAIFFLFAQAAVIHAAEEGTGFELWPRGRTPGAEQPPPPPSTPPTEPQAPQPAPAAEKPAAEKAAEKAGEEAGKKTAAGVSAGTIGKWALVLGGIALIAVAVGGGGGGGGSTSNH